MLKRINIYEHEIRTLDLVYYNITFPEKPMAAHSIILAWRIPWMDEPGGLQSMGSLRVGHD